MSEWRYRPVPAGIANTVTGLLQRDKTTSVFARCTALGLWPIPDVALQRARATRAKRCTLAPSNAPRTFSRRLKTPIIYSFSAHPTFRERRQCRAGAKLGRSQNRAQRRVKHTKRLVQKKFSQEACKRDLGDRNRHESSESRRSDSPNPVRRRTTEDTRGRIRASVFFSRPPPGGVRRRACA